MPLRERLLNLGLQPDCILLRSLQRVTRLHELTHTSVYRYRQMTL